MLIEPTIRIGEPTMTLGQKDLEKIQQALWTYVDIAPVSEKDRIQATELYQRITERLTPKGPPCR